MDFARYLSLIVVIVVLCSVSVKTESESSEQDVTTDGLNLILNPKLLQALYKLLNPTETRPVDTSVSSTSASTTSASTESEPVSRRRKRFSQTSRVDSKVTKLKTPKSEDDGDVPVIRGLAGLSPIEFRLLNEKGEQDDGKLIRTTTEKSRGGRGGRGGRTEKNLHQKKDDDEVPIITGTKDANNPSRQEARAGKSADDDNTVVLLNGATAQRAPPSQVPPPPPPRPSFRPPPPLQSPPSFGGRTRCQQRKLLLQLDEQLAVLRKLNEQREADIARSMSWVEGAGGTGGDQLRHPAQQIPNVPIPYFPYVSNLPIYGRSDWTPLPLPPSFEYQVSGYRGPPVAGIYRRSWVPSQVPADTIDCDYEDERTQHHQGGTTPAPNAFRGPGLYQGNPYQGNPYQGNPYQGNPYQGNPGGIVVSTPAPNNFRRPGFEDRSLRYPGGYGTSPTPGTLRRDGYGRAWAPGAPRVEVDDKVAKPKDDPAEDEEQE